MKIINKEYYRSKPIVNMTDDLVRITITAKRHEIRQLERFIKERPNTQMQTDGLKCSSCGKKYNSEDWPNAWRCNNCF